MNTPILKPSERLKVVDSLRGFALLAIVLLHNTSSTNGKIIDELLTRWEDMGYTFQPLSHLWSDEKTN